MATRLTVRPGSLSTRNPLILVLLFLLLAASAPTVGHAATLYRPHRGAHTHATYDAHPRLHPPAQHLSPLVHAPSQPSRPTSSGRQPAEPTRSAVDLLFPSRQERGPPHSALTL